ADDASTERLARRRALHQRFADVNHARGSERAVDIDRVHWRVSAVSRRGAEEAIEVHSDGRRVCGINYQHGHEHAKIAGEGCASARTAGRMRGRMEGLSGAIDLLRVDARSQRVSAAGGSIDDRAGGRAIHDGRDLRLTVAVGGDLKSR